MQVHDMDTVSTNLWIVRIRRPELFGAVAHELNLLGVQVGNGPGLGSVT